MVENFSSAELKHSTESGDPGFIQNAVNWASNHKTEAAVLGVAGAALTGGLALKFLPEFLQGTADVETSANLARNAFSTEAADSLASVGSKIDLPKSADAISSLLSDGKLTSSMSPADLTDASKTLQVEPGAGSMIDQSFGNATDLATNLNRPLSLSVRGVDVAVEPGSSAQSVIDSWSAAKKNSEMVASELSDKALSTNMSPNELADASKVLTVEPRFGSIINDAFAKVADLSTKLERPASLTVHGIEVPVTPGDSADTVMNAWRTKSDASALLRSQLNSGGLRTSLSANELVDGSKALKLEPALGANIDSSFQHAADISNELGRPATLTVRNAEVPISPGDTKETVMAAYDAITKSPEYIQAAREESARLAAIEDAWVRSGANSLRQTSDGSPVISNYYAGRSPGTQI